MLLLLLLDDPPVLANCQAGIAGLPPAAGGGLDPPPLILGEANPGLVAEVVDDEVDGPPVAPLETRRERRDLSSD